MGESPGCCSTWARCLRCLYSCHWRKCPKERRKSNQCECFWFGLLFLTFLVSLGWLYVGLILLNDLHNFNEFLFRHWGHWMDWSLAFMLFVSLLVTYASLLLLLAMLLRLCGQPLHLHCVHKVLLFLIILLVAAGFALLGVQWQEELLSLHLSLQATAPFLHIGAVVCITILAWPVADAFYRIHQRGRKIVLLFLFFGVVLAIYLSPLCISSPCIMESTHLPPKPKLMGHRGAPMLAPENTLMSLRKTAECGAAVFETDVMVSSDGVPFLMHDERLSRTTDVASVFPTRITAHSSDFSWAELKRLNAGAWFLERPPFWEAKKLSGPDRKEAENQRVPTLKELLKEAAALNLSIMFDLRRPPRNHTYYDTFVNQTLETVLDSRVSQAMVLWLPDEDRATVQQQAPGMSQVYGQQGVNTTERPLFLNLPYQDLPQLDMKGEFGHHQRLPAAAADALPHLAYCPSNLPNGVDPHRLCLSPADFVSLYPPWALPWTSNWLEPGKSILGKLRVKKLCPNLAELTMGSFSPCRRCAEKRERTGLETAVLLTKINNVRRE